MRMRTLLLSGVSVNLLSVAFIFLAQILVLKMFGEDVYGGFMYYRGLLFLAVGFGGLGVAQLFVNSIPHLGIPSVKNSALVELVTGPLLLSLVATVLISFFIALFVRFFGASQPFSIVILVLGSLLYQSIIMLSHLVRVLMNGVLGLFLERLIHQTLFFLVLVVVFFYFSYSFGYLLYVIYVVLIFVGAISCLAVFLYKLPIPLRYWTDIKLSTLIPIFRNASSFYSISLAETLSSRFPLVVAGFSLSMYDVASLGIQMSLAGIVLLPLQSIGFVVGPKVAQHASAGDPKSILKLMRVVKWYSSLLALFFSVAILVCLPLLNVISDKLVDVEQYQFLTLVSAMVISSFFTAPMLILKYAGLSSEIARAFSFCVFAKVLVSIVAVFFFGLDGIIFSELFQSILLSIFIFHIFRRYALENSY